MNRADRRIHPRARTPATTAVVLARDSYSGVFVVDDLSSSGACLVGRLTLATGELVKVIFDLDGRPITVAARVVRIEPAARSRVRIAVEFRDVSYATQHFLQRLVLASIERART